MRLINVRTMQLVEFIGRPPPYAILSHMWSSDEVTYDGFRNATSRARRAGYAKIRFACKQAARDGLDFVWVDTCCIDRASSAELSEAVNSMFRWYENSTKAYVFLEDVGGGSSSLSSSLASSRWFTRGWTLQELIAPKHVEFYSHEWVQMGTKIALAGALQDITGIDRRILTGETPLASVWIGTRMRWAALRKTTRAEDAAYCLVGLFGVSMPVLYGEGASRAFRRLQEEILKDYDDHTIFAWCADRAAPDYSTVRGVLATSPREFATFEGIEPIRDMGDGDDDETHDLHLASTNKGIRITARALDSSPPSDSGENGVGGDGAGGGMRRILLPLNCRVVVGSKDPKDKREIGIRLVSQGGRQFARICPDELFVLDSERSGGARPRTLYMTKHTTSGSGGSSSSSNSSSSSRSVSSSGSDSAARLPVDRDSHMDRDNAFYFEHMSAGVGLEFFPRDAATYFPDERQLVLRRDGVGGSHRRVGAVVTFGGVRCGGVIFGLAAATSRIGGGGVSPSSKPAGEIGLLSCEDFLALLAHDSSLGSGGSRGEAGKRLLRKADGSDTVLVSSGGGGKRLSVTVTAAPRTVQGVDTTVISLRVFDEDMSWVNVPTRVSSDESFVMEERRVSAGNENFPDSPILYM